LLWFSRRRSSPLEGVPSPSITELQKLAVTSKEAPDPRRRLLDLLDETYPFTPPKWLVDEEFRAVWRAFHAHRNAGELDRDDIGKDDRQLRREYRLISDRRVRLGLIIAEIAKRISFTSAPAREVENEVIDFILGLAD
jgi:FKBP-type peptidyl-prolyl cis-trans isomerase (trigger factor)